MRKEWIEKTDSKGNKILVNPNIAYRYKEKFDTSFLINKIKKHKHTFKQFNSFVEDGFVCSEYNHLELI